MSSQTDCFFLKPGIFQISLCMAGFLLLCFWMTWESPLKFSLHMGWERKWLVIKLILLLWRDNLLPLWFGLVDLVWGGFAVYQRFFSGDMDSCKRNWSLMLTFVNPMARGWKWLILVSFLELNFQYCDCSQGEWDWRNSPNGTTLFEEHTSHLFFLPKYNSLQIEVKSRLKVFTLTYFFKYLSL